MKKLSNITANNYEETNNFPSGKLFLKSVVSLKGNVVGKKELNTVKEVLYWSYANLAMAHTAIDRKQEKYVTFNYMIRAKLFKGLTEGTMKIRTLFDDEKVELLSGNKCSYCVENNLMECSVSDLKSQKHPFNIESIPVSYPKPKELVLIVE